MTRDEIILCARLAGLDLAPDHLADLMVGHERIQAMLSRMPTGRPRGDEPAHVFAPLTFLPADAR